MRPSTRWHDHPLRSELLRLLREVDALTAPYSCTCATTQGPDDARCCQFGVTGREPYPTPVELCEVDYALRSRGTRHIRSAPKKRRLPLESSHRDCPLLSQEGRCTIYESRPFGCRTHFCPGHGPPRRVRDAIDEVARRVADLAARAFPRDPLPRPFTRALDGPLPEPPGAPSVR